MMQQQDSRSSRFKTPERTVEDLNRICGNSFRQLKIPANWKFIEYDRVRLNEDPESEIQSITAIFKDMNTGSFNLTHYRVNFHTYSERLSLVQVTFDFGKPQPKCMVWNKVPEQMNEYFETLKN